MLNELPKSSISHTHGLTPLTIRLRKDSLIVKSSSIKYIFMFRHLLGSNNPNNKLHLSCQQNQINDICGQFSWLVRLFVASHLLESIGLPDLLVKFIESKFRIGGSLIASSRSAKTSGHQFRSHRPYVPIGQPLNDGHPLLGMPYTFLLTKSAFTSPINTLLCLCSTYGWRPVAIVCIPKSNSSAASAKRFCSIALMSSGFR